MRSAPFIFAVVLTALGGPHASVSAPDHELVFASAVPPPSPPAAVRPAPPVPAPAALPAPSPSATASTWIDDAIAGLRAAFVRQVPVPDLPSVRPAPPAPAPPALPAPSPSATASTWIDDAIAGLRSVFVRQVPVPDLPAVRPAPPAPAAAALPAPSPSAAPWIDAAVADLSAAMVREVPGLLAVRTEDEPDWNRRVAAELAAAGRSIDHPQLLVTVDRNPAVQQLRIVLARPNAPWLLIGATHVSTGEPGLTGHYKTPVGVFEHTSRIIDYRAEGTYSRRHHLRGLGVKGMRVWDFGWHTTEDWRERNGWTRIRLEIHATDPVLLEPRIGQPSSKGCVHVSAALNRFLDRHGVIDADYERAAETDGRYRELLLAGRTPTPLAGTMMVVFDSSRPDAADLAWPMAGLI
jgi:hypothetical protein